MTQTVLQVAQSAALREGLLNTISSVATPVSNFEKQFSECLQIAGRHLTHEYAWPQLIRHYYFTLISGLDYYGLPNDFLCPVFDTFWNTDLRWPIQGPMSPQEWMVRKFGWVSSAPYNRYKITGSATTGTFIIEPKPDATTAGDVVTFQYLSSAWSRPAVAWAADTPYTTSSYVFVNERKTVNGVLLTPDLVVLKASTTDTSGLTSPVITATPSYSDGTIVWQVQGYERFANDTDVPLLDEELLALGTIWRYLRSVGKPFEDKRAEYDDHVKQHFAMSRSARTLSMASNDAVPLISYYNVPDSGIGL